MPPSTEHARSTGLVLAGAAALGAYEVGALCHLVEEVVPEVGAPGVLAGTSAGAINAAALAAFADEPTRGTQLLERSWGELEIGRVLRPSALELLAMMLDVAGASSRLRQVLQARWIRGGLLDSTPIAQLVGAIPMERIATNLASGHLRGIALSTTRVATGAAVVFHQSASPVAWAVESNVIPIATRLATEHVLASAAIPLLFPTVTIGDEAYCDGGLRQMVPLSPAIHLGASRLLVINPLPAARVATSDPRTTTSSPLYLAGKALNALFADRMAVDLERLAQTTAILRAGERCFGPTFATELNLQLAHDGKAEMRTIDALVIEPARDLGALAAEHVRSGAFGSTARTPAGRLLRRMADGDPERAGDLLAFLLFDGSFTRVLLELGRADARARHDQLCELLAPASARAS